MPQTQEKHSQAVSESKTFQHDKNHYENKIEYIFPSNQGNITFLW